MDGWTRMLLANSESFRSTMPVLFLHRVQRGRSAGLDIMCLHSNCMSSGEAELFHYNMEKKAFTPGMSYGECGELRCLNLLLCTYMGQTNSK